MRRAPSKASTVSPLGVGDERRLNKYRPSSFVVNALLSLQGLFKVGFVGAGPRTCPVCIPPISRCASRAGTGTCPYESASFVAFLTLNKPCFSSKSLDKWHCNLVI